ncbi:sulfur carrier protein ThiS [Acidimicrobiaceae bacterium USS-CC1]|uniref:Sulfur carrier protein ThiS n=1 Tax=Acidiferrimicrobium australe TaxID=2664430 RepID=A0ABW9QYB5_9ACTN|nr:sulfur carrier protein ThiS [Acidiferrimicrobium australe]
MELVVNGEHRRLGDGATVDALVETLALGRRGVAVAVNSEIVPRSAWTVTHLTAGDVVEVLHAVQGG